MDKIEGISAGTVGKILITMRNAGWKDSKTTLPPCRQNDIMERALLGLLASGEVVLRKDVENKNYYAWLIEQRDENGKPTWLCDPYYPEFTDNAWDALHFGRKSDAEAYADSEMHTLYITEHAFPALTRFTKGETK